jgi:hypothetical protein
MRAERKGRSRRWRVLVAVPAVAVASMLLAGPAGALTEPINQEIKFNYHGCTADVMYGNIWGQAFAKVRPTGARCYLGGYNSYVRVRNGTGSSSTAFPRQFGAWKQVQLPGYVSSADIALCASATDCFTWTLTPF